MPDIEAVNVLNEIINSEARSRWTSPYAQSYTPARIKQILASAWNGCLLDQWTLFDLMEDTWPRLSKNLSEIKEKAKRLEWSVMPWSEEEDEPTTSAQEKAQLCKRGIWDMKPDPTTEQRGWEETILAIVDAYAKGFSVMEIDWELRSGEVLPKATRWVNPQYYALASEGNQLMLNPVSGDVNTQGLKPGYSYLYQFPPNKFLIAKHDHKVGAPGTNALLRPLAFYWAMANFTSQWLMEFSEMFGTPFRWATYKDKSPGVLTKLLTMLKNVGRAGYGAFPEGTEMNFIEPKNSITGNPQTYSLEYADKQADLLILHQTLTTDVGDSGSRALGDVHESVRADVVMAVAGVVEKVINEQLFPSICQLNYGNSEECPWIKASQADWIESAAMLERDKQILSIPGVKVSKQWFFDRHGLPMPEEGMSEEDLVGGGGPFQEEEGKPGQPGKPDQNLKAKAGDLGEQDRARNKLADAWLEQLTGVEGRWLGSVKPFFTHLIAAAESETVTDKQLVQAVQRASDVMPELFRNLDTEAVADALEKAMGAAAFNGANLRAAGRRKS